MRRLLSLVFDGPRALLRGYIVAAAVLATVATTIGLIALVLSEAFGIRWGW